MAACGQYSAETMRAELFGYKKGAFTGAEKDTKGLLFYANKDTLFLDEIGDISFDLQRLLIKALEEKEYFPLGSQKPEKSNFRIITATNIPFDKLKERLSSDFLDRISMLVLRLPSLYEIPEDIEWLWKKVYPEAIKRAGLDNNKPILTDHYHNKIISDLKKRALPGNLRDLFRVAYRLIAAISDSDEPMNHSDAVEYALKGVQGNEVRFSDNFTGNVMECFIKSKSLNDIIQSHRKIETNKIIRDVKGYIAKEIRQYAKDNGVKIETICDKTGRSLQSWEKKISE